MAVAVGGARKSACEAARRDQDQGQAVFLCLVSEDGDLSSSGSSISDEDRSQRRTNQRLIITIQMNVHSCIAWHSCIFSPSRHAPRCHPAPRCCTILAKFSSAVTWMEIFARVRQTCVLAPVSRGGVGVATCCDGVTLSLQSLLVTPGWRASPC